VVAVAWAAIHLLAATLGVLTVALFSFSARIDSRIVALEARLNARIDALEDHLTARIDRLEQRLDAHIQWHAG